MKVGYLFAVFAIAGTAFGQFPMQVCSQAGLAWCAGGQFIYRCEYGDNSTTVLGNCDDNLAGVPPYGVKTDAICWQSNATSGDAQCTYNCVDVTAANGTTFFPLGCTSGTDLPTNTATGAPQSTSLSYAPTGSPSTTSLSGSTATGNPSQSATKTATSNGEIFDRAHILALMGLAVIWVIGFL